MIQYNQEKTNDEQIIIPIGREGEKTVYTDLASIPSILISGTTGSGKTAFVQSLLVEMMENNEPKDLRLIICTSKPFEYELFMGYPHLLIPVVTDKRKVNGAINWLRFEVRDRNNRVYEDAEFKLPNIFLIMDDCAEMLMDDADNVEAMMDLLKTSRQARVHCWLVTSTPSYSVVATVLKANLPGRACFHVTSRSLSRIVIGTEGAELLQVPGEMIFKDYSRTVKCQALYYEHNVLIEKLKEMLRILLEKYKVPSEESEENPEEDLLDEPDEQSTNSKDGRDSLFKEAGCPIIESEDAVQKDEPVKAPEQAEESRSVTALSQESDKKPKEAVKKQTKRGTNSAKRTKKQKESNTKEQVVKLTPQNYVAGIEMSIASTGEYVAAKKNKETDPSIKIAGELIERLRYKKSGFFSKGTVSVYGKDGLEITVDFKES